MATSWNPATERHSDTASRSSSKAAQPARPRIWARQIPLQEIDRSDLRFQHRLFASSEDLVESIREHGQRTPVHLAGGGPPYTVVDGFRRIDAMSQLGRDSVLAVVEDGADEQQLFALSFAENVRRRSYTAHDKAHAIWQALRRWGLAKPEVAGLLGLSVRQVDRYLHLLTFGDALREALASGRLSMAHAVILHRASGADAAGWIEEIGRSGLSAAELAKRLKKPARRRGAPAAPLVRDLRGFRLGPIRYRHDLALAEKRRIWDALEAALRIVAESERR
jgi:ParB family chromosome partitioning protein